MSRPCTERQAAFLAENGFNPDHFDFHAASQKIDEIIAANPRPARGRGGYSRNHYRNDPPHNRPAAPPQQRNYGGQRQQGAPTPRNPNAPATAKQKEILTDYNYDTNVTISEASRIISALKANNWEPLPQTAATNQYDPNSAELPWN